MKKKLLIVAMLVVVIMTAVLLAGCNKSKMTLGFLMNGKDGMEVFVEVDIDKYEGKMLSDLFLGEDSLGAKLKEGQYGFYFEGLQGIDVVGNTFINTYTSSEEYKDTSEFAAEPITIDGVTYYQANKGISYLPVEKDIRYLFVFESY